jgi:ribosomal protein S18 acetylase RimI-like enzyme
MSDAMKHAFESARLRVFMVTLIPSQWNTERMVFVACRRDVDRPMVAATCMVNPAMLYVDWIEVSTDYRRESFATELWRGIEKYLGASLDSTPGSDAGEELLKSLGVEL